MHYFGFSLTRAPLPDALVNRINKQLLATGLRNENGRDSTLYYYGDGTWILQGRTPVGVGFVLSEIDAKGGDTREVRAWIKQTRDAEAEEDTARRALIASARAKLTPEEIKACGL